MRDGDFTRFCDREHAKVLGALILFCGDRDLAEEVTAEAFARAYRDWRRVRGLEALQRLRADHRAVLVLRYFLDLSVEEVAASLGRSSSAVTSLTQRAAVAFREELPGDAAGGALVRADERETEHER